MSGCSGSSGGGTGNPGGGAGSLNAPCPPCTITSQTFSAKPSGRARTTIGVGEEVTLTFSLGSATWTLSGSGKISSTSGASVVYTAGERAGSATISATGSGCTASIAFTVVEPSGILMSRTSLVRHKKGKPDCGFLARPYLLPNTVSFYRAETREKNSKATANGYFLPYNGITHQPKKQTESAWYTVGECVEGIGSPANCQDQIYSGYTNLALQAGTMTFPITWDFRVGTGAAKSMPDFEQKHTVTAPGDSTSAKGGASETTHLNDADSGY
jgi:hypothetical protein